MCKDHRDPQGNKVLPEPTAVTGRMVQQDPQEYKVIPAYRAQQAIMVLMELMVRTEKQGPQGHRAIREVRV